MNRKAILPELLAPAGSEEALLAACAAGADAAYLGVAEGVSNARTLAENFTREQLLRLIPLAHAHGVRIYVTLNTLVYDREMPALLDLARFLYEAGADALIVADLGLARALREALPDLPLHASTQAFTHSARGVRALSALGFSRVVLARELSEANIREATKSTPAETEIFLHGALCVSHSGQCLFSSLVGGRSGNRGACAQPCRLPYGEGYPLSLKDYCLARHIPALIDSGVASLKIEGRMKSPAYVYGVTRIYRRLLDERRAATDAEMEALARIFSRDGFTDGYFTGDLSHMGGVRRAEDKAASREESTVPPLAPVPLHIEAAIRANRPAALALTLRTREGKEHRVRIEGEVPLVAERAALTPENVNERLAKLGGTGFAAAEISLSLDEGLFLPVGALNALRRAAVEALYASLRTRTEEAAPPTAAEQGTPAPLALARTAQFFRADTFVGTDTQDFDACFLSLAQFDALPKEGKTPNGVALPPVIFDSEESAVKRALLALAARGVRYALVSSLGAVSLAKECGFLPFGDFRLNITNEKSAALYREMGLCGFLSAAELAPSAARRLGASTVVYGRIPLMLTERCFVKESAGCGACGRFSLLDRKGVRFPVLREAPHRALVVNSVPTYLGDTRDGEGVGAHFLFTVESAREANDVLRAASRRAPLAKPVRRAFK
ncbi:MAG: U32 family peptidase [Clostridia bacterium]|nr:U32 family peptidase [Clostridia bacterium]